jgi:two-component system, NarL family, response regulator YdfI
MPAPKKERTHKQHPPHIWVVAPSSARRASLSDLITKGSPLGKVEVTTSSTFTASGAAGGADIVVADIDGSTSGAALIRFMTEAASETGFVALIDDPDPSWVQDSLKAGISAIVSREPSGDEVRLALEAADAGLVLLLPTTTRGLFSAVVPTLHPAYEPEQLTARETEVLRLLSEGLGNKEIASRLSISEHTVKFHISSILGKLSVATRTEAVSQGIRRGLIPI